MAADVRGECAKTQRHSDVGCPEGQNKAALTAYQGWRLVRIDYAVIDTVEDVRRVMATVCRVQARLEVAVAVLHFSSLQPPLVEIPRLHMVKGVE